MAATKTYRAITEVHVTETPGKRGDKGKGIAPTPPSVVIVKANGLVDMDPNDDTTKELLSSGAIEVDKSDSKATPQKIGGKKAEAKKGAEPKTASAKTAETKAADAKKAAEAKGTEKKSDGSEML